MGIAGDGPEGGRTFNEAKRIAERLRTVAVGECVAYDELSATIDRNVQREGKSQLSRARRILRDEDHMVFLPVRNVALRRLSGVEIVELRLTRLRHLRHMSNNRTKELDCVQPEQLSPEDALKRIAELTIAEIVAGVSTPKGHRKICRATEQEGLHLPAAQAALVALANLS